MLITLIATLSMVSRPLVTVSVEGNGFFQFAGDGHALYTSCAPLVVVDGWLSYPNGAPLLPTLRVPEHTTKLDVSYDGEVFATTPNFRARVGRISLATFAPDADLRKLGNFIVSSNLPTYKDPGDQNVGTIHVDGKQDPMRDPDPVAMPLPTTQPFIEPTRDDAFVQEWVDRIPSPPILNLSHPFEGEARVNVSAKTDCNDDQFTLGDIAVIDAPNDLRNALMQTPLGDAPKPGKRARLSRDKIFKELSRQGFDTDQIKIDLPDNSTISRRSQEVSSDDIKQTAIQAAALALGTDKLKANLRLDTKIAPAGELSYTVESCVETTKGANVIVVTLIDGMRYNSHLVRVSRTR